MQDVLEFVAYRWEKKGYPTIKIRVGIHTDNVFVGNLGAPDRMK